MSDNDTAEAVSALVRGAESEPRRGGSSNLRHDLRTPINQIIGYSELLAEEAEEEGIARLVPDLEKIRSAAGTLLELVERIPLPPNEPVKSEAPRPKPTALVQTANRSLTGAAEVKSGEYVPPVTEPASDPDQDRPARLLVVDDIELNRSMLGRRFGKRGFEVTLAEGGQDALDKLASDDFDLVLLDIMMPDISGYDVLETVRRDSTPIELPIVMVTAKDEGEDIVKAFKLGANDYITKPVDFKVALIRVETLLSRKRAAANVQRLAVELERHNQFIRKTFGRYLSKDVVESLLSSPEGLRLGGEKRQITILMSDLRGFSGLSETRDPETIVGMLNGYLGTMADIVTKYGGTIDEFIGDAILALFGAPIERAGDAERAVACAIEMQQAMEQVNEDNRNKDLPELEMGIAVNTGECVVGNIGSQQRAKYGVVGRNVNLAGRIESYTIGGQILVSSSTVDAIPVKLKLGPETKLAAKGFREPVSVYEVSGIGGDYQLELEERKETLKELVRPIPVSVSILEGKHVSDERFEGAFEGLSMHAGEMVIRGNPNIARFGNLKVAIRGLNDVILPDDLYAKVTEVNTASYTVRFTSVPESVKSFLRSALAREVTGDSSGRFEAIGKEVAAE